MKLDLDTKAPMLDAEGRQIMVEREISIPMFKPVKVFDVSQTYGKPLPQLASTLSGAVKEYGIFLEALRRTAAIPVSFKPIPENTDGFFSLTDQSITIREGMSEVQTVSALIHEIAHSRLHNYEKLRAEATAGEGAAEPVRKDRRTEEVEAESVSYSICQYFGMPGKLQFYKELAEQTLQRITGSYQTWTGFLVTAARLYKYPFHEQLMIYAQRPEATACAEYDLWNNTMRRYVRRGSQGIALIDTSGDNPRLKYVFDVSDTSGGERSRRPFLWEYRDEHFSTVTAALEQRYDVQANLACSPQRRNKLKA